MANVILLMVSAWFFALGMMALYFGISDYNRGQRNYATGVGIATGVVVAAASFAKTIQYFGAVLNDWDYAESMEHPGFWDAINFASIGIAGVGIVVGVSLGVSAITYRSRKEKTLQKIR